MMNDDYLFCPEHCDLWQSGCERCERCCQHHYGMTVKEKFHDDGSLAERSKTWIVASGETFEEMQADLEFQKANRVIEDN